MSEQILPIQMRPCGCRGAAHHSACRQPEIDRLSADLARLRAALEFALTRCEDNGFPNGDLANVLRAALEGQRTPAAQQLRESEQA